MLKPKVSIKMISQPIVDLQTGETIMQEWLCRPSVGTVEEYFAVEDPLTLWRKEAECIEAALSCPSTKPKLINITLSSLPYFLDTNWTWDGGIECLEWGPRQASMMRLLPLLLQRVHQRGLKVWVDDLIPARWLEWKYAKVDGYKVAWNTLTKGIASPFIKELQSRSKPIIVEWVENQQTEEEVKKLGIRYAQGFYYNGVNT